MQIGTAYSCSIGLLQSEILTLQNSKMKKITLLLFSVSILMVSCIKEQVDGNGPLVTEARNITNFSGLDLRCSANVVYKQDPVYKVEITAQQNILDVMITEVSNSKLVIKYKND